MRMNMIFRILMILALLTGAANADTFYECSNGKQRFAKSDEKRAEMRDRDPVVYIKVRILENVNKISLGVIHVLRSGREIDRMAQYAHPSDGLRVGNRSLIWSGSYDRDPTITMIGTLRLDLQDVTYTETRYKNGQWEWNNVTQCVQVHE